MIIIGDSNRARILTLWLIVVAAVVTVGVNTGVASATPAVDHFHPAGQRPVVTSTSSAASSLGGTLITIHGQHLSTASGALFGSVPGTNFHALSDSAAQVRAPAHTVGVLDVRLESSAGLSPITVHDRTRYELPTPAPTRRTSDLIDPDHQTDVALSCPTATFCGLAEPSALAVLDGDHVTSSQELTGTTFTAVSCPSADNCVAIGYNATHVVAATLGAGSWAIADTGLERRVPISLSCPSVSWCDATDGTSTILTERDGQWSTEFVTRQGPVSQVSCPTEDFCAAAQAGAVAIWRGSTWTLGPYLRSLYLTAISCSSPTFCVTLGDDEWSFDGTNWTKESLPPAVSEGGDVSCWSNSRCLAVGDRAHAAQTWERSAAGWAQVTDVGVHSGAQSLSWSPDNACQAGYRDVVISRSSGSWAEPFVVDHAHGRPTGLGCAHTSEFCVLTDVDGNYQYLSGTAWTTPRYNNPFLLTGGSIACTGPGMCLSKNGFFDGTRWRAASPTADYNNSHQKTLCASPTLCIVTPPPFRQYNRWNGAGWGPTKLIDSSLGPSSVADCGTTMCFTLRGDGLFKALTPNTTLFLRYAPASGFSGMSCFGEQFCMAVSKNGVSAVWRGDAWDVSHLDIDPDDIACRAADDCLAVRTRDGAVRHWDGFSWSALARLDTHGDSQHTLAVTRTRYIVAGDSGYVDILG